MPKYRLIGCAATEAAYIAVKVAFIMGNWNLPARRTHPTPLVEKLELPVNLYPWRRYW